MPDAGAAESTVWWGMIVAGRTSDARRRARAAADAGAPPGDDATRRRGARTAQDWQVSDVRDHRRGAAVAGARRHSTA
ncbi:MAG TPA: hypothetical protein VFW96_26205 [Thermomicrobiales bacterium]|nr:hypothetical protein [Thermomicrobiales bacterium]